MTRFIISKVTLSFAVQYQYESENSCAIAASQSWEESTLIEILYENNKNSIFLCRKVAVVSEYSEKTFLTRVEAAQ
jgi:hypothetical protein